MTEKILEILEKIKPKYEQRLELKDRILSIQNEQSMLKINWLTEANAAEDNDGKQKFKNEAMREGYVKEKLHAHESFEIRNKLEKEMAELEVEIRMLELEFEANKAILLSKSGNTINFGGK